MFSCSEKIMYFLLYFTILFVPTSCKQYRTDYVYNSNTDAFYKFHTESVYYSRAKALCELEGAKLVEPVSEEDYSQIHAMFKQYPDLGDEFWIGIDGQEHEPAEENPMISLDDITTETYRLFGFDLKRCNILTRNGDVETLYCFRNLPFVCKVFARDAYFDTRCMVYGKDYHYYENERSCYKIPDIALSWNQAYAECRTENAHLLVLNSEAEWQLVLTLINSLQHTAQLQKLSFYVGIRTEKSTTAFKTIFNQTLESAGYSKWFLGRPSYDWGTEHCGTVSVLNGRYYNVDCSRYLYFICENEVKNT